jgi:N-acetyl-gamma-glutamyl-phosphate reductase
MSPEIFIDGEAGTTGLLIRKLLAERSDLSFISLDDRERRDAKARKDALNSCTLAILCLPDEAAREAITLIENPNVKIIDTSTAHRVSPEWIYGFPEMTAGQADLIKKSNRVANPGCYPTGAISLVRPLIENSIIPSSYPLTVNAVSGYSGGGKSLIKRFETEKDAAPAFYLYGTTLSHKHLPEMQQYIGLDNPPFFTPSVGKYMQGMIVQVPIYLSKTLNTASSPRKIYDVLSQHYDGCKFVTVNSLDTIQTPVEISPEKLNHSNMLEINVFTNKEETQCLLTATLDNLGKGASRAAIQSMDLMLDL